jgi:hypothetical protein
MPLFTFMIGLLGGFIAGMIVAAGGWREALGKLGAYASNAARTPPATPPSQAVKTLPAEAAPPTHSSLS